MLSAEAAQNKSGQTSDFRHVSKVMMYTKHADVFGHEVLVHISNNSPCGMRVAKEPPPCLTPSTNPAHCSAASNHCPFVGPCTFVSLAKPVVLDVYLRCSDVNSTSHWKVKGRTVVVETEHYAVPTILCCADFASEISILTPSNGGVAAYVAAVSHGAVLLLRLVSCATHLLRTSTRSASLFF